MGLDSSYHGEPAAPPRWSRDATAPGARASGSGRSSRSASGEAEEAGLLGGGGPGPGLGFGGGHRGAAGSRTAKVVAGVAAACLLLLAGAVYGGRGAEPAGGGGELAPVAAPAVPGGLEDVDLERSMEHSAGPGPAGSAAAAPGPAPAPAPPPAEAGSPPEPARWPPPAAEAPPAPSPTPAAGPAATPASPPPPVPAATEAARRAGRWGTGWQVVDIRDFGAVRDGETDNTAAIKAAIERCRALGGCTLRFGPGRWVSYPLRLYSNFDVVLEEDCTLMAITESAKWPSIPYKEYPLVPANEPHPVKMGFIHAVGSRNITIRGGGKVDGQGQYWWRSQVPPDTRPHLLLLVGITGLTVRDITLENSPKWTLHPMRSKDVHIENVHVLNPLNNDKGTNGIVIDSCEDVYVTKCTVDTGYKEDAFAVKSGSDWWGRNASAPSRNVLFEDNDVMDGHALSIGSEMSGGVYNVTFRDIRLLGHKGKHRGTGCIRIKSARGRGGVVDGVTFDRITGHDVIYGVEFYMYFSKGKNRLANATATPVVRNVNVTNVHFTNVHREGFIIGGLPESPFQNLLFENVTLSNVKQDKWRCTKYKQCTWKGGGCALGRAVNVSPAPAAGCLRATAP